jgi:hypothetical protein
VTVRYRLALQVEADGKQHTGSGVIQATYGKNITLLGSSAEIYINIKGEAVAVDIPGRGTLFAVLKAGESPRSSPQWIVPKAFGFRGGALGSPPEPSFNRLRALTGRVEIAPSDLPLLVRFRDINDPKTVERVDSGNLAASFGRGVFLERAFLEITRDAVTRGIEKRLAWLEPLRRRGASLDGDTSVARSSNELANILGPGSFQIGVK